MKKGNFLKKFCKMKNVFQFHPGNMELEDIMLSEKNPKGTNTI